MDSHRRHLGRGFNWLGGATIVAKLVDSVTILAVLLFLTKTQVGIASLVVSIGMVVEAFDGLGTGDALVQARSVEKPTLDTLFWLVIAAALVVAFLTLLAAPLVARLYGVAGMAVYFLAIAAKQPLVGAAVIPLAMMNRDLQYERIAMVNVGATLAAALVRLGLAVMGAGAWAIVIGFAASGFFIMVGAFIAKPFRPGRPRDPAALRPLLHFGVRSASANVLEQTFKNIDYLLVGGFYGAAALAVYRVAFDIAMEPAMAVGTVVNRAALPVFAKVAAVRDHLAELLTWSLRRIAVLVAPLMVALILAADPLMALLHDRQGHSYAAAALPLKLLAGAALLRVVSQLLSPLMLASGRPGVAARLSAVTLLLLTLGILAVCLSFPASSGIVAVSAVWLCVYPFLLAWGAFYLARHWDMGVSALARAFRAPALAILGLVAVVTACRFLVGGDDPGMNLAVVILATGLTYAGLLVHARRTA